MARGDKGGGGGDTKKKASYAHYIDEGFEFLSGAFAGQLLAGFTQSGFMSFIRGLQGKLFDKLFSGKTKADEAKAEDVSAARKTFMDMLKKEGADPKVMTMGEEYMSSLVAIAASGKPDDQKRKDLDDLKKDFKAKLDRYQLEQTKKGPDELFAELAVLDARKPNPRTRPHGRPRQYTEDFRIWLFEELDPARQSTILNRFYKIKSAKQVATILDQTGNHIQRYQLLMLLMGHQTLTETMHEVVDAVASGNVENSPAVQRLSQASADNVRARQTHSDMQHRAFNTRRKV